MTAKPDPLRQALEDIVSVAQDAHAINRFERMVEIAERAIDEDDRRAHGMSQ